MKFFTLIFLLFSCCASAEAQQLRFPEIERSNDVVVLVGDVASGRILGGVRTNQAFTQQYHPASVFKLAIAAASLAQGKPAQPYLYTCRAKDVINGITQKCWTNVGHGELGLESAIAHSCNLYFRRTANYLSAQEIISGARFLGMLTPSGFPGSGEQQQSFTLDDENVLGEAFLVSPAQLLRVALVLASRGRLAQPSAGLDAVRYQSLYRGMRECVRIGTARAAWSRKFSISGKTGTDDKIGVPHQTVGWFVGFAPSDRPQYAITVLYRYRRGSDAAAIAKKILEQIM